MRLDASRYKKFQQLFCSDYIIRVVGVGSRDQNIGFFFRSSVPSTQHLIVENSERTRSKLQKLSKSANSGFKGFTAATSGTSVNKRGGRQLHQQTSSPQSITMTSTPFPNKPRSDDDVNQKCDNDVVTNGVTSHKDRSRKAGINSKACFFGSTLV